jgi:hypothetical protein
MSAERALKIFGFVAMKQSLDSKMTTLDSARAVMFRQSYTHCCCFLTKLKQAELAASLGVLQHSQVYVAITW